MLGYRHEPILRPLSPLRNAPPRGLEAHNYLSADHSSGSSAAARRRDQHARDHAQQSQVSFPEGISWPALGTQEVMSCCHVRDSVSA